MAFQNRLLQSESEMVNVHTPYRRVYSIQWCLDIVFSPEFRALFNVFERYPSEKN